MSGFSIIIPAHNEASVIESTLRSLLKSRVDRPLQIIVVANGCRDETADRARAVARETGGPIEVIETPIGGKTNALNLGDRAAHYFPRAYLDADIEISENALQSIADAFKDPQCHVAAPSARHVYRGRNPILAGYYALWRSLPYVRKAVMGCGFYAVDRTLRSRFVEFPMLTADDKFIRNLTEPSERRVVEGCYSTVSMPETFADLLKVKTRWTYGSLELSSVRPDLNVNDQHRYKGVIKHLLLRPWLWPNIPAFVFVYVYAQQAARKKLAQDTPSVWERDDSTRPLPSPSPHPARPAA
jgi:cellulose synthase/poly-beta-1,6-N-acetylglucosamine synthase-like glycosyltransferase